MTARRAEAAASHPDEATTAAYIEGAFSGEALERIETHLADCDPCRAGVTLLRAGLPEDEASTLPAPPDLVRRARGAPSASRLRALPIAAGIVLVAAAGISAWMIRSGALFPESQGRVLRNPGSPAADPLAPLAPPDGATAARDGLSFSWTPVAGADRYVVTLLGPSGDLLATLETAAPGRSASWPAGASPPPRGTLVWKVRALALDRTLAESRPATLDVR